MLKAHKFHVKFTVHTIMSEGGDVTMEEDYTLSYRTEEWEPESPNNLKFSKTHIQGAKITHRFMAANEWMTVLPNGRICFEDGCEQTIVEFWAARRNQTGWTDGWSVFNEAK